MKKIPETFNLDEDDLKEAITYWLNNEHNDDSEFDFDYDIKIVVTETVGKEVDPSHFEISVIATKE